MSNNLIITIVIIMIIIMTIVIILIIIMKGIRINRQPESKNIQSRRGNSK